jgi:hypothetical protein
VGHTGDAARRFERSVDLATGIFAVTAPAITAGVY